MSNTTMAQSIDLHDSLPGAAASGGWTPTVGADPRIDVKRAGVVRDVVHLRVPNELEPAEVDWAEARLADREVLVRMHSDHRVSVWQVTSGEWFRAGGHVNFQCGADGVERFTIHLYAGANAADYLFLSRVVDEAKAGKFQRYGWREVKPAYGGDAWRFDFSRKYLDAGTNPWDGVDRTEVVTACTDSRCQESVHFDADRFGALHTVDEMVADDYVIAVSRYFDAESIDNPYAVSVVSVSENMSPDRVASFVSDLQWMAETCRRTNETVSDAVTKGMRDPAAYWAARRAKAVAA